MSGKDLNIFFALLPDRKAAEKLEALAKQQREAHKLKGKPFKADQFHLSLQTMGTYNHAEIDAAGRAAVSVKAEPFTLAFENVESFDNSDQFPRVLRCARGESQLLDLYRQLGIEMKMEGLGRFVSFDYTPHVTLLYADRIVESHPAEEPISWLVEEFALVLSHVGETRYDFLGQWSLGEND